jgi:hypothetical protein
MPCLPYQRKLSSMSVATTCPLHAVNLMADVSGHLRGRQKDWAKHGSVTPRRFINRARLTCIQPSASLESGLMALCIGVFRTAYRDAPLAGVRYGESRGKPKKENRGDLNMLRSATRLRHCFWRDGRPRPLVVFFDGVHPSVLSYPAPLPRDTRS